MGLEFFGQKETKYHFKQVEMNWNSNWYEQADWVNPNDLGFFVNDYNSQGECTILLSVT